MRKKADDLLPEAMAMPTIERARLAEKLIASLEPQTDEDVEAAWQEECARRLHQIEQGEVELVPWECIRERLRNANRAPG